MGYHASSVDATGSREPIDSGQTVTITYCCYQPAPLVGCRVKTVADGDGHGVPLYVDKHASVRRRQPS